MKRPEGDWGDLIDPPQFDDLGRYIDIHDYVYQEDDK